MNIRAGVVVSQVAWFTSLPLTTAPASSPGEAIKRGIAGFLVAGLASALPDLDHATSTVGRYIPDWVREVMGGHRMLTHSLLSIAVMWWLTRFLLDDTIIANAMAVGWAGHIAIDCLTKQGCGLLYPLVKRKFRIGWMVTGSEAEDRFVTGVKVVGWLVAVLYGVLIYQSAPGGA